jgi:mitochondrial enoyl-[acyl-carrier protein] reductase / trans-2-enoyl-CoA reductase
MPAACRLLEFGKSPAALDVGPLEVRPPGPGEVLVRMLHAPVNPADINVIDGTYGQLPDLPAIIGNEGCGEVVEVGEGVEGFLPGTMVLALGGGTWASHLTVPAGELAPLPAGVDPVQASMLLVNPCTAWCLLHDFVALGAGDWVVQNAANSGVGRAVIRLARTLGVRTLNLVRRPDQVDELLEFGGDVVVTADVDLRREVEALCGGARPVLGLNAVGGPSALNVANALASGSPLATYGAMGRQPLKIPNGLLIFRGLSFRGFWLSRWRREHGAEGLAGMLGHLGGLLHEGILQVPVAAIHPLGAVGAAVEEARTSGRSGKVVLDLREDG